MSDEDYTPLPPYVAERDRPIHEQVAVLRHDLAGMKTAMQLITDLQQRMTRRVERLEFRSDGHDKEFSQRPPLVEMQIMIRDELIRAQNRRDEATWLRVRRLGYILAAVAALAPWSKIILERVFT